MPDSNEPMVSNLPVSNEQLLDKLDSMDNTLKGDERHSDEHSRHPQADRVSRCDDPKTSPLTIH